MASLQGYPLSLGQWFMHRFMNDPDLRMSQGGAAGFVGNGAKESAGFTTGVQKLNSGNEGPGKGFWQWDDRGPAFANFLINNGFTVEKNGVKQPDYTSPEGNFQYAKHELLNTPEGKILARLQDPNITAADASRIVHTQFERPFDVRGGAELAAGDSRLGGRQPTGAERAAYAEHLFQNAPTEAPAIDPKQFGKMAEGVLSSPEFTQFSETNPSDPSIIYGPGFQEQFGPSGGLFGQKYGAFDDVGPQAGEDFGVILQSPMDPVARPQFAGDPAPEFPPQRPSEADLGFPNAPDPSLPPPALPGDLAGLTLYGPGMNEGDFGLAPPDLPQLPSGLDLPLISSTGFGQPTTPEMGPQSLGAGIDPFSLPTVSDTSFPGQFVGGDGRGDFGANIVQQAPTPGAMPPPPGPPADLAGLTLYGPQSTDPGLGLPMLPEQASVPGAVPNVSVPDIGLPIIPGELPNVTVPPIYTPYIMDPDLYGQSTNIEQRGIPKDTWMLAQQANAKIADPNTSPEDKAALQKWIDGFAPALHPYSDPARNWPVLTQDTPDAPASDLPISDQMRVQPFLQEVGGMLEPSIIGPTDFPRQSVGGEGVASFGSGITPDQPAPGPLSFSGIEAGTFAPNGENGMGQGITPFVLPPISDTSFPGQIIGGTGMADFGAGITPQGPSTPVADIPLPPTRPTDFGPDMSIPSMTDFALNSGPGGEQGFSGYGTLIHNPADIADNTGYLPNPGEATFPVGSQAFNPTNPPNPQVGGVFASDAQLTPNSWAQLGNGISMLDGDPYGLKNDYTVEGDSIYRVTPTGGGERIGSLPAGGFGDASLATMLREYDTSGRWGGDPLEMTVHPSSPPAVNPNANPFFRDLGGSTFQIDTPDTPGADFTIWGENRDIYSVNPDGGGTRLGGWGDFFGGTAAADWSTLNDSDFASRMSDPAALAAIDPTGIGGAAPAGSLGGDDFRQSTYMALVAKLKADQAKIAAQHTADFTRYNEQLESNRAAGLGVNPAAAASFFPANNSGIGVNPSAAPSAFASGGGYIAPANRFQQTFASPIDASFNPFAIY